MTLSQCFFIVLCFEVLVQVLSRAPLAPPQDVYADKWLLTWTPATDERNLTYTVQSSFANVWRNVSACTQISFSSCNVTLTKAEGEHGCVMLRVQAERRGLTSTPVEACSRHGDSCSPEVSLTARPGSLTVHLSRNHSMALEYGYHAKHRVYYGKEGEPLQEYGDAASSVSIRELQEGQRYCIKVQYIYHNKRIGLPSCTQCKVIPESRKDPKQTEIIVAVVVVVVLVILIPVIAYILIFQRRKIKQWLRPEYEIPDHFLEPFPKPHRPISTSSPCEEHRDVISCFTPEEFRE